MGTAALPRSCDLRGLLAALKDAGALGENWVSMVISLPPDCFVDCSAMSFLCAWGMRQVAERRRLLLRGDKDVLRYLARMDLHRHLHLPYDEGHRRPESGRFYPLHLIATDDDVFAAVNEICDLFLHQFEDARAFVPALEWAVNEIVDNILLHAESPVPGVVCAQFFPKEKHLDVAICDAGRGIKASLSESRQLWSHGDAITTALQRGVTRNPEIGQGNGMAGALEIVRRNHGGLRVWSGDVVYRLDGGIEKGFETIPLIPGTGVSLSLDTTHPVNLADTWIATSAWSFLNAEAERISEHGGIDVARECLHTGTRAPARALRRKILALLPDMHEGLVLDFSEVKTASSSFLDELVGRLADELGEGAFDAHIHIAGMSPAIRGIANAVLEQRLRPTAFAAPGV